VYNLGKGDGLDRLSCGSRRMSDFLTPRAGCEAGSSGSGPTVASERTSGAVPDKSPRAQTAAPANQDEGDVGVKVGPAAIDDQPAREIDRQPAIATGGIGFASFDTEVGAGSEVLELLAIRRTPGGCLPEKFKLDHLGPRLDPRGDLNTLVTCRFAAPLLLMDCSKTAHRQANGEPLFLANGLPMGLNRGSHGMRSRVLLFAMVLGSSVPAVAQETGEVGSRALPSLSGLRQVVTTNSRRPVLALPIIDYANTEGGAPRPRGIIAGRQIAPGTVLGLGIFERERKMRGYVGGIPQNMEPKKTKQAAVGLSIRF
jgi:hypothetical protein